MSMYEIDSAYVRRCQKRLQEWGAPLSGWYCDYIYDVADEDEDSDHIELFTCELCDCTQVRFVHVMRHNECTQIPSLIFVQIMLRINLLLCGFRANIYTPKGKTKKHGG